MLPTLETIYPTPGHSFCIQAFTDKRLHFNWHYHQELELLAVAEGRGQAHIGDMAASFRAPAVFLIGQALPHGFVSENAMRGWIIQFDIKIFRLHGGILELEPVTALLAEASRGIAFGDSVSMQIVECLADLERGTTLENWATILKALSLLTADRERTGCSKTRQNSSVPESRIEGVISEIFDNIGKRYCLEEVSAQAGMPKTTFCRRFKKQFGLSFSKYLISIRINNAKKLLIQTKLFIDDICYESGFGNVAFFNRKFKALTGMTPRTYRKLFAETALSAH